MIHPPQRWRDRCASFRPVRECVRTAEFDVAPIEGDAIAKAFIVQHHYSGSYPAARFRFGLYHRGVLAGVAVFSHPCRDDILKRLFGISAATDACELGRFVLLDYVGANAESWFLARCFERLRKLQAGVVSHSDPVARTTADGRRVFAGHLGIIYQATNAVYLGLTVARKKLLLPDGTEFSARTRQKILAGDRGWQYAASILERHGADPIWSFEERKQWLDEWLPRITRPLRHTGNHRYAWTFSRRARLPQSRPYPKGGIYGSQAVSTLRQCAR